MNLTALAIVILAAFGIGVVAGLRSLTAPAVTAWAAHLDWLHLQGTPFKFMGLTAVVTLFTLLALVELVTDKLPSTPSRTAPPGLIARVIFGGLSGAAVAAAAATAFAVGAVFGALGGIAGAFAGYQVRSRLVRAWKVPDFVIAVIEDVVAIGVGLFLVSRF
jgi:uncharacterized membrane protein